VSAGGLAVPIGRRRDDGYQAGERDRAAGDRRKLDAQLRAATPESKRRADARIKRLGLR
jgi:hypothetical protein